MVRWLIQRRRILLESGICCSLLLLSVNVGAEVVVAAPEYDDQVSALRANGHVQSALAYVITLQPQSLQDLVELTEIPAPPFKESARAKRFSELLTGSGLSDVVIDEVGNVIGRRPGSGNGRVVAYSGHLSE